MSKHYRKRWRHPLALFAVALLLVFLFGNLRPEDPADTWASRRLFAHGEEDSNNETNVTVRATAQFPTDLFTLEQRKQGAVVFHVIGLVYMFVALAIVCDEFFIPALDVITDKMGISEDVAGATFMAAGGSAPELFTSVIGVFISFDDVGIGTIVGSAVFNILFVISMCAIFSKTVLELTWWPLFRDVTFYAIVLIILMVCFQDSTIHWYEAAGLLFCYGCYVTFMKFNEKLEKLLKKLLNRNKVTRVGSTDHLMPTPAPRPVAGIEPPTTLGISTSQPRTETARRRMSTPILHAGSKFRHGLLQLMIHTIDPLHEDVIDCDGGFAGKLDEKASQLHAIASLRVLLDATKANGTSASPGCNGTVVHAHALASRCATCATCPACSAQCTCLQETVLASEQPSPVGATLVREAIPRAETLPSIQVEKYAERNGLFLDKLNANSKKDSLVVFDLNSQNTYRTEKRSSPTAWSESTNPTLTRSTTGETAVDVPGGLIQQRPTNNHKELSLQDSMSDVNSVAAAANLNTISASAGNSSPSGQQGASEGAMVAAEKEAEEPLDIRWPKTFKRRVNYILLGPIIFPLWLTLPDVRRPEKRRWFAISFLGSIMWIAIFSYLMVWWATLVGDTVGIPNEVMGLTFLAAGTSIPDLITSVLVARKGFGDMAVSSSVGSNIFDVTVGLPLPWLLACFIFGPVTVSSAGMTCSVFILFMMLMFVIGSIAAFRWRMNVGLAVVMFMLYFVFIAVSLMLEYGVMNCQAIISSITGR